MLQKAGVAAFPALSQKELFDDRHFTARGDWVDVEHPLGKQKIYGMPWKLSKTPGQIRLPGTMVGQYNDFAFRRSPRHARGRDRPPRRGERLLLTARSYALPKRRAAFPPRMFALSSSLMSALRICWSRRGLPPPPRTGAEA